MLGVSDRSSHWPLALAEIALLAATTIAIAATTRLFADTARLLPILLAGVAAHIGAAWLRRAGVSFAVSLALFVVALALLISFGYYRDSVGALHR